MIARLAALALPVFAGIAWMLLAGAATSQIALQLVALAIGCALIVVGARLAFPAKPLGVALVVLLYLPLALGPEVGGEQRWLALGPVTLTSGLLCVPALSVLLARARRSWFVGPLALIFVASLVQSDPSITIALAMVIFVLGGINLVAIAGGLLILAIGAYLALRDTLEPVRFVEGVFPDAFAQMPLMTWVLIAALVISLGLLLWRAGAPAKEKAALVASMTGLIGVSLIGPFPTPLVGYGAASILGLSLALAILGRDPEGGHPA
ncbi:hypothetical protein [Erythrobacter litoralis]|uniref:Peptidoglycan polymerase n=1 Tax=Erythrobacter litoralis (strain HTCC2594) TaxID=314225 RepID=Q2N9E3_ERYLH|nr:hypothetical protein [Erythrobacter litoralis]ABC63698.1 hypothetical protein ELI_08030 [Erythrobacter litoralis HTCC2594]